MSTQGVSLDAPLSEFLLAMMSELIGEENPTGCRFAIYDGRGNTITLHINVIDVVNPMVMRDHAKP